MRHNIILIVWLSGCLPLWSQTDVDGLFMAKRNICGGFMATSAKWDHYWEGTLYRNNLNMGTVSSRSLLFMANYGITDKVNFLVTLPWIQNEASAGTLIRQQGIQDLSLMLKNEMWARDLNGYLASIVGVAGVSFPVTDYVADYLPLSLGTQTTNVTTRIMADVQKGHWYATASLMAMLRGQATIDRNVYYTTQLIYSNKVDMPRVAGYNVRLGWRQGADKVLEALLDGMNTVGGFDMRRNDMPFLSNNMDVLRVGVNGKYLIPGTGGLSLLAAFHQVIAGRNAGKSSAIMAGLVYQFAFKNNSNTVTQ